MIKTAYSLPRQPQQILSSLSKIVPDPAYYTLSCTDNNISRGCKRCTTPKLLHRPLRDYRGKPISLLSMLMDADLANSINQIDGNQHRRHCNGLI